MFETELSTFNKHAQQLRKDNPMGGFVIIKGNTIFPEIWSNYSDAIKNGNRLFGNDSFLIKGINEEEPTYILKELYSAINSQREQMPSLIEGRFTNTTDGIPLFNTIKLRKYCLEKAIEIFSLKRDFFFTQGEGPVEYAEVLYNYISTGTVTDFKLPGMRDKTNRQEQRIATPTPIRPEPV